MTHGEQAILNAVKFLRTQPDCKTAANLLMKKLTTEKLIIEGVKITGVKRKHARNSISAKRTVSE